MWSFLNGREPPPEATWEEYSTLYKDLTKSFTHSEFDKIIEPLVYYHEDELFNQNKSDDQISNFLSYYYIYTHKGKSKIIKKNFFVYYFKWF